ncbi:class F sortase [Arenimonas sp.]|nr:class F sortase [Candidatus Parcubacteria bacterium]
MKLKKISKKQSLVILFIALIILACYIYVIKSTNILLSGQALVYNAHAETIGSMRLRIPKIDVNARVESMGLTSLGAMDAPKGPSNVGLYNLGPRPGEVGNSVMDGHFGWKNKIPAVFDNLNKLVKGDKIYVDNGKGSTRVFVVRQLRVYKVDQDASEVFISSDGKTHLNLITCSGLWDSRVKNRPNRLVVFADME